MTGVTAASSASSCMMNTGRICPFSCAKVGLRFESQSQPRRMIATRCHRSCPIGRILCFPSHRSLPRRLPRQCRAHRAGSWGPHSPARPRGHKRQSHATAQAVAGFSTGDARTISAGVKALAVAWHMIGCARSSGRSRFRLRLAFFRSVTENADYTPARVLPIHSASSAGVRTGSENIATRTRQYPSADGTGRRTAWATTPSQPHPASRS
jgi:hypothetical protein